MRTLGRLRQIGNFQSSDHMESTFHEPADCGGILAQAVVPGIDSEIERSEQGLPFRFVQEIQGERDVVMGVAEPIHSGQSLEREEAIPGMILEDDPAARNSTGFA